MRFLSTRTHGLLDYGLGVVLIASPYLLGFADGGAATWVLTIAGAGLLVLSAMTDYELGMVRVVRMPVHLAMDMALGVLLILSPVLFGFGETVWLPHVVLGAVEVGISLVTRTKPDDVGASAPSSTMGTSAEARRSQPTADAPRSSDLRPTPPVSAGDMSNSDQARRAIDSGSTRDKVAVVDPAAAPLGTDDEAAAQPDEEGMRIARAQDRRPGSPPHTS